MKLLSISVLTSILLVSCQPSGSRGIASYERTQRDIYRIGEVKTSLLSPEVFRQEYGSAWVLMQGQKLDNDSDFEKSTGLTFVPDARGKFLRMANNGAEGASFDSDSKREIGSYQSDLVGPHSHGGVVKLGGRTAHGHSKRSKNAITGSVGLTNSNETAETRPKNIAVNFYVKVSYCHEVESHCL